MKLKFLKSVVLTLVLATTASLTLTHSLMAGNFNQEQISEIDLNLDPQMLLGLFDQLKGKFTIDKQVAVQKLMQFKGALDQAIAEEHFSSKIDTNKFEDASEEFRPNIRKLLVSFMRAILINSNLKVFRSKADSNRALLVISDAEVIPAQLISTDESSKGRTIIVGQLGDEYYVAIKHADFEKLYTALFDAEASRYLKHFKDEAIKFVSKIISNMNLNQ